MAGLDRSILLVEGEVLIASDLERKLKRAGYTVIGPAGSVAEALVQIVQRDVEAALLNIKIGQELTKPVLDVLAFSKVPFVLVSSQSSRLVPEQYRNRPFLSWPCSACRLLEKLKEVLPAPRSDRI